MLRGYFWLAVLTVLVVAAVVVGKFFIGAAGRDTQDLPFEYAGGNPLALRELARRPYNAHLSETFRSYVANSEPKVRLAALTYLTKGTEPAEVPVIIGALSDGAPEVRIAAVEACAERDIKQSVGVIIGLLDDPSVDVRGAAQTALRRITGIQRFMGRNEWEEHWRLRREGFE